MLQYYLVGGVLLGRSSQLAPTHPRWPKNGNTRDFGGRDLDSEPVGVHGTIPGAKLRAQGQIWDLNLGVGAGRKWSENRNVMQQFCRDFRSEFDGVDGFFVG